MRASSAAAAAPSAIATRRAKRTTGGAHKAPCRAGGPAPPAPPIPAPAGPFVVDLHCGHCGAEVGRAVGQTQFHRCGACARVAYCGGECQEAHWPAHKAACLKDTVARVHAGEGELAGAEGLLRNAWDKAREELGGEHLDTLACMNAYSEFLRKVGRSPCSASWRAFFGARWVHRTLTR